jgi:hypothetical protein
MDKWNNCSHSGQTLANDRKITEAQRLKNSDASANQDQRRREEPPEEALEHWEDEGGHLIENGNGRN